MSVNQEFVVWRRSDVIILDKLCERQQILEQINELNFNDPTDHFELHVL